MAEQNSMRNGWFVPPMLKKYYRFVTGHMPPRPFAVWEQLRLDARHLSMLALWLACGWQMAYGAATHQWANAAIGAAILAFWLLCLVIVSSGIRNSPLAVGVIGSYSRHWQFKMSKAKAVMADGREIDVVIPTSLVKAFVHGGRQGLALFLDETKPGAKGYCLVFAMRAMPEGPLVEVTSESTDPIAT